MHIILIIFVATHATHLANSEDLDDGGFIHKWTIRQGYIR